MTRKNLNLLAGAIVILISIFFSPAQINTKTSSDAKSYQTTGPNPSVSPSLGSVTLGKVVRIVDGDTFEIEGGQKVRLIGIDTPETVAPNKPVACFGQEASNKTKEIIMGQEVKLEKDISETDKYGRLLRYVYVANPEATSESVFVNDFLVKSGYAQVSTYPPDVKYQNLFLESQRYAKENNLGLWGKCF